jgi:hypothetical protein
MEGSRANPTEKIFGAIHAPKICSPRVEIRGGGAPIRLPFSLRKTTVSPAERTTLERIAVDGVTASASPRPSARCWTLCG